jgi:hypothetical protein
MYAYPRLWRQISRCREISPWTREGSASTHTRTLRRSVRALSGRAPSGRRTVDNRGEHTAGSGRRQRRARYVNNCLSLKRIIRRMPTEPCLGHRRVDLGLQTAARPSRRGSSPAPAEGDTPAPHRRPSPCFTGDSSGHDGRRPRHFSAPSFIARRTISRLRRRGPPRRRYFTRRRRLRISPGWSNDISSGVAPGRARKRVAVDRQQTPRAGITRCGRLPVSVWLEGRTTAREHHAGVSKHLRSVTILA